MANFLRKLLGNLKQRVELYSYRRKLPKIVKRVRAKEKIKVLFVLSELSLWKTESLYRAMLSHPRFDPVIGLTLLTCDLPADVIRKYEVLKNYLEGQNYQYKELSSEVLKSIRPDIAFYQQPYDSFIADNLSFSKILNQGGLICDVHYSFRILAPTKINSWVIDLSLYRFSWQLYLENEMNLEYRKVSMIKGKNFEVTGVPFQDELLKHKDQFSDPWLPQNKKKKRIIYAPHHTIPTATNLINISCFLDVCDIMLEMAEKYSEEAQFAFKPHPFLKHKLVSIWGEEKTQKYYDRWKELSNGQIADGSYVALFQHSDALIHDCDSFVVEYCFMKKPILYTIRPDKISDRKNDLNRFGRRAFDLHDYGYTKDDIDSFISSVINAIDTKFSERESFYQEALQPPKNKSAVNNIIGAILGE